LLIRESLDEISARGGTGLEKVAAFIRSYTDVIAVDFGRAVIRLDDGELSGEAQAEVRSYKREIDRRLRSFIQEGIDDGSIAPSDAKLAAFAIAGALNWISMWYRPGGALSAEEVAESYTAILTNGLSNRDAKNAGRQPGPKSGLKLVRERAGKGRG
jgi:AcrR family transcriptional regulator